MVYVDTYDAPYGRMIMCHMMADSEEELLTMANEIGVSNKWLQPARRGRPSHFDICKTKKQLAIKHGAIEVTPRELVLHFKNKEKTDV